MYNRRKVEMMKTRYLEGTRICLDRMENDPHPIPSGTKGTVIAVDDAGQLLMKWDNGRSLSLIPGEDQFHVIQQEENLPWYWKYSQLVNASKVMVIGRESTTTSLLKQHT